MKRSTVRLLLLLVLLVFVVPIAAFAAEDNETNSTPAAVETTPAPASAPAPASGTGSTEGPAPSQQPAATNEPTPAETPATPTGTTPGETPATPTGTTPGETPAAPTGTTPGETPATTDGTTPEDKPDAAEEDEENPEPAAEKDDVENEKLAGIKKLGSLRAVPGDHVIGPVDMQNRETKTGNFTIGTNGYVRGPESGMAIISNATVTNDANNTAKGKVPSSNGSAFIARARNGSTNTSLSFRNVKIDSLKNYTSIVLNIWEGASINVEDLTLDGPNNDSMNTVFMLVGDFGGKDSSLPGSLNLSGSNTFSNITGTIAGYNGKVNIGNGATLTIKDSAIQLSQNASFNLVTGANLVLDNAQLTGNSDITVPSGAALTLKGNRNTVSGSITVQDGGKLILNGARMASDAVTFAAGALLELQDGASFELKNDLALAGVKSVGANNAIFVLKDESDSDESDSYELDMKGGKIDITAAPKQLGLTITNTKIKNATINVSANNTTTLNNCTFGTEGTFNNHYINVAEKGTLVMDGCIVKDHSGSFVAIRANSATVKLTDSTFQNNNHEGDAGGAIRGFNATTIQIDNCKFTDNRANRGGAVFMQGGTLEIDKHLSDSTKKSTFR